jgi:rSAM/selenodomain-associated transferase 1
VLNDAVLITTAVVYLVTCAVLFAFGANLIAFSIRVWRRGPSAPDSPELGTPELGSTTVEGGSVALDDSELPRVTVQLPIYNELYVSRRVIEAACAFDWPADRLQIQVLDDSTDATSAMIAQVVADARAQGIDIEHLQRDDRVGYKAGALGEGMHSATGEYLAIFDADFVPEPDFLRRSITYFDAPDIAFVQARWGHVNRDYSWLTRLQALAIDGHFLVEQSGRGLAGYWFNFNGTAGLWRRDAIVDAGGWKADTLTEDLDLSYRAHLRGWRARYAEDIVVPAEVPVQITGFRRQQHRWARGSLECAAKLLPGVWRSGTPLMTRVQATLHLGAYTIQLLLLLLLLIYPLVVLASRDHPGISTLFGVGYGFAMASLAPTIFFLVGSRQGGRRWQGDLLSILAVSTFGAGLMANTARAALQIFTKPNPSFERTAKYGVDAPQPATSWTLKRYQLAPDPIVLVELALAGYAGFAAYLAIQNGNWGVLLYSLLFGLGLLAVAATTIAHTWSVHRNRGARAVALQAENEAFASRRDTADMTTDAGEPLGAGDRAVIIMAKRPAPGATKTRLAVDMTMEQAASLYERFLADTICAVDDRSDCTLVIAIDQPESADYFSTVAPGAVQVLQRGETLGERLDAVMTECLDRGFTQVLAIGSDSPDLPDAHLDRAFDALDDADVDVVLGPTEDGGYYLIGWKQPWPSIVREVQMSTPSVLADTLVIAERDGVEVALAPSWYDVDEPDDLERLRASLDASDATRESRTADFLASL